MMKNLATLLLLLVGLAPALVAQPMGGDVDYAGNHYRYTLRPKRTVNQYDLLIDLIKPDSSLERVYEGGTLLAGKATKGQVFKVTFYKASKEGEKWVNEPQSYLETTYDYVKQKVSYRDNGSIKGFAVPSPTETVNDDVANLDQPAAIQLAVEYLVINYPRILMVSGRAFDLQAADSATVRESVTLAGDALGLPMRQKFFHEGKTYLVQATGGDRGRFNFTLHRFEGLQDEASITLMYDSYFMLRDSLATLDKYNVHLHLSVNNGYRWQTYPASYLECSFEPAVAAMRYRPVSKIREYQQPGAPAREKVPSLAATMTKEELVVAAVKYFVIYYPKLLINNN
jgi:hypothetical protein